MKVANLAGGALALLVGAVVLMAQTARNPGELAYGQKVALPQDYESGSDSAVRKPDAIPAPDKHDRHVQRIWIASMVALGSTTAFDAGSLWHKRESDSLLASPGGTFGGKGLAIKASVGAGVLLPQILFRKHKDLRTAFSLGNLAEAGIFTGTAIHNLTMPSLK